MLLVDDERDIRVVTSTYLRGHGYEVVEARTTSEARTTLDAREIQLVVLDLGLPDGDGLELLRELRTSSDAGVVIVTGRGEEPDRVVGLELGADDYVVKPFSQRELVARIAAVLRRRRPTETAETGERLRFGRLQIDTAARAATVEGRPVELTRREYDLLAYLATRPGRSHTHEQLLAEVWDSSAEWQSPRTLSEHVYRLRRKLALGDGGPAIATVRGVGYRFDP